MGNRKNLFVFASASVVGHFVVAALILFSFEFDKHVVIQDANLSSPLQISINNLQNNSPQSNTAKSSQKPTDPHQVKSVLETQAVSKATSVPTEHPTDPLSIENVPLIAIASANQSENNLETEANTSTPDVENTDATPILRERLVDHAASLQQRSVAIHEKLSALISINKKYPAFAVRRGWEGKVELGLRIEANGDLTKVRVIKTSGYSLLDEAALTMLTSAQHINGIESWLDGDFFDTTLPVIYQLTDG